MALQERD